jgi:hypothetical protein
MATLEKLLNRWTGVGLGLLLAASAPAGEKVRFGTGAGGAIQTQPQRSIRESITPQAAASFNQVSPAVSPVPVASPVVTRNVRPEDEDQRNWIFRDTRSAAGMQKALGVDTFDEQTPTVAERDSVAVINDYFSRQRAQTTASPALGSAAASNWGNLSGGPAGSGGLGASALGGNSSGTPGGANSGTLFGESSFRNSLNSDNQAVRNYFRELYTSPGMTGAGLGSASQSPAGSSAPNARPSATAQTPPTTENQNLLDIFNRAALVDSLSTIPPGAPTLNAPAPVNQPGANSREVPTVNQGNLFERRSGGIIEIPARKF